jgi:uncharacterized membrane protein
MKRHIRVVGNGFIFVKPEDFYRGSTFLRLMKNFLRIFAIIILIVSIVLLFDKLFTPQPIQIVLQSGEEITTQNSNYFTLMETILLIICAFLIGTTTTYLFYNSDKNVIKLPEKSEKEVVETIAKITRNPALAVADNYADKYETILPLLKDDEKKVIVALREAGGTMLQNQLVLKMNLSKVKITRLIASLESKNLVAKERNGLTNCVRLI